MPTTDDGWCTSSPLKVDRDEYITIQRATKTVFDKAARWEISYGNTRFYSIYSDDDTPPSTSMWDYNSYAYY